MWNQALPGSTFGERPTGPPGAKILNGWKEISTYLGRGLRTVQRWELVGLPVRRPRGKLRGPVITTAEELDGWVANCGNGRKVRNRQSYEMLLATVEQLTRENQQLRNEIAALRSSMQPPVNIGPQSERAVAMD